MPDGDAIGEGDCWGGPIGEGVWGGGIGEDWGEGLVIPPRSTASVWFSDLQNNPIKNVLVLLVVVAVVVVIVVVVVVAAAAAAAAVEVAVMLLYHTAGYFN
jgi:hypothetical protein